MNEYVNLTIDNIDHEHVCCAIGDPKHQVGVSDKKEWLKDRMKEGHVFRKLDEKGKIFVEYAPLEYAWVPISGNHFYYIYCLWVSGRFKGKGIAGDLMEYVINDAKQSGRNGICTLSAKKKKPFLGEKKFFEHYGFRVVDTIGDYELLSLSFTQETPAFNEEARKMTIDTNDFTIYYSPQCPYVVNGIREIHAYATANQIPLRIVKVDTLEKAKHAPCVFHNWANFKDGKFISHTLLNKNSFQKLISVQSGK